MASAMFSAALDLAARQVHPENQAAKFSYHQAYVQRVLAVASSTTSIVFCLVAFYFFLAIDPRRLVFRHQLIFFLIFFDLLKAVILLLYPSRVLTHLTAYFNDRFCQVVGFFSATAIEGADIAILSFAVHTFLLIFQPQLSVKVHNSNRTEGGLYRFRYYVYVLSFIIPLFLASLAFINHAGYSSFVCWCYLPQQPIWYRLVLSWVPRYVIVVLIFTVYGSIYFHVIREFKTLGGVFTTIHRLRAHNALLALQSRPSFISALTYFLAAVRDRIFPKLVLPETNLTTKNTRSSNVAPKKLKNSSSSSSNDNSTGSPVRLHIDTENILSDPEIQAANLENFRKRQKIIEKQMKSIFIYPFAYIFLWLFPFILQITQFSFEEHHHAIYWLNCMGAFMQPLNGFIDVLVFFYREQPWEYTIMKNFEKEHESKIDSLVHTHNAFKKHSSADTSSVATSARLTKNSLSASMGVDISRYPKWRQYFSKLHLPLFKLPTEDNVAKFQIRYLNNKIDTIRGTQVNGLAENPPADIAPGPAKHDFSSILNNDMAEKDFRSTFENFSLNFSQRRSSTSSTRHEGTSGSSGHRLSVISPSTKSGKLRHISMTDPNEPVIHESRRFGSVSAGDDASPRSQGTNSAALNAMSLLNTIQQQKRANSSFDAPQSNSLTPPRATVQKRDDVTSSDNSEMDFLDFLRKGP